MTPEHWISTSFVSLWCHPQHPPRAGAETRGPWQTSSFGLTLIHENIPCLWLFNLWNFLTIISLHISTLSKRKPWETSFALKPWIKAKKKFLMSRAALDILLKFTFCLFLFLPQPGESGLEAGIPQNFHVKLGALLSVSFNFTLINCFPGIPSLYRSPTWQTFLFLTFLYTWKLKLREVKQLFLMSYQLV